MKKATKAKFKKLTVADMNAIVAKKPKTKAATLNNIERLLGNKANWIKDQENNEEGGVCLIGAIHEVDGKFESDATSAIKMAICKLFPTRVGYEDNIFNLFADESVDSILQQLSGTSVLSVASWLNISIPEFNDHDDTTHADVKKVLKEAKVIKKVVDTAKRKQALLVARQEFTALAAQQAKIDARKEALVAKYNKI